MNLVQAKIFAIENVHFWANASKRSLDHDLTVDLTAHVVQKTA